MQETWVQSVGWEDPLGKEMAPHSSTLAWRIPWTEPSFHRVAKSRTRLRDFTHSNTVSNGLFSVPIPLGLPPVLAIIRATACSYHSPSSASPSITFNFPLDPFVLQWLPYLNYPSLISPLDIFTWYPVHHSNVSIKSPAPHLLKQHPALTSLLLPLLHRSLSETVSSARSHLRFFPFLQSPLDRKEIQPVH